MTCVLDNMVAMVLSFLNAWRSRVQYAVMLSIVQFAESFYEVDKGKNRVTEFHDVVLPALTELI
jgi:hypothetical protein